MLRDHVESIRSSLVVADSHATKDRIHRRVQKGELIRLLTGICIPSARLIGLHSRERETAVFIARMCALSLRYPDYVISGGVAAYLLGLPCEARIGQLTLYAPSRKCPTLVHFPEVVIDDSIRIPSVCVRTCRPGRPVSSIEYAGLSVSPPYVFVRAARAVQCLPSNMRVSVSRHRRELLLTALAYSTKSTGFPSPAQGWPTRASLIVSVRMRRGRGRRKRGGISTRPWMPLPATPEGAGTPVGSWTMLTLVVSLPARPWFSSRCCAQASQG